MGIYVVSVKMFSDKFATVFFVLTFPKRSLLKRTSVYALTGVERGWRYLRLFGLRGPKQKAAPRRDGLLGREPKIVLLARERQEQTAEAVACFAFAFSS
jgi:hypothetical protein